MQDVAKRCNKPALLDDPSGWTISFVQLAEAIRLAHSAVEIVQQIPKAASGKIARRVLHDQEKAKMSQAT